VVVYCVGCLMRNAGQDPNWFKQHGKDCSICYNFTKNVYIRTHTHLLKDLAKKFLEIYAEVVQNLAGQSHSNKLGKALVSKNIDSEPTLQLPLPGTMMNYKNSAKIAEKQKVKIEWLMFRMFIC